MKNIKTNQSQRKKDASSLSGEHPESRSIHRGRKLTREYACGCGNHADIHSHRDDSDFAG